MALGVIGLTEKEFYTTTPRTFNNILKGYNTKYRDKMELHREMLVTFVSPHLDKKDKGKTLPELMPLPWEAEYKKYAAKTEHKKNGPARALSEEEIKRIQESYKDKTIAK